MFSAPLITLTLMLKDDQLIVFNDELYAFQKNMQVLQTAEWQCL